jgi:hypothetical protein
MVIGGVAAQPAAAAVYRTTGGSGSYQASIGNRSVSVSIWVTQDQGGRQSLQGWVRFLDTPVGVTTPWTKIGECTTLDPYGVTAATCKFSATMPAPYAGWHRLQVAYSWLRTNGWENLYETSGWFYVK